jgi:hypothetical protein
MNYQTMAKKAWKLAVKNADPACGTIYCQTANIGADNEEHLVIGNGHFFVALPPGCDDMLARGMFEKRDGKVIRSARDVPNFGSILPAGELKTFSPLLCGNARVELRGINPARLLVIQNCTEQSAIDAEIADFFDDALALSFRATGKTGIMVVGDQSGVFGVVMPCRHDKIISIEE